MAVQGTTCLVERYGGFLCGAEERKGMKVRGGEWKMVGGGKAGYGKYGWICLGSGSGWLDGLNSPGGEFGGVGGWVGGR